MSSEHDSRRTDEDTEVLGRAKDWTSEEVNIGYIERPEVQYKPVLLFSACAVLTHYVPSFVGAERKVRCHARFQ